ncbi:MAG: LytTR family DNA-binding domain-containing protein, partial [Chitinophagaceae bacterium]
MKVITKERTIISKQPISSVEQMISPQLFLRIHRSFIVAINKIDFFT